MMSIKFKISAYLLLLLINVNVLAAILDKKEAEQADLSLLEGETRVFQSIGMGIALSIAQCEGIDLCSFTVDEDEIQELINALETRIDSLVLRQEEIEDPEGLEKVLMAYVNERDNYTSHLEKLKNITSSSESDDALSEDSFELEAEPDFPVEAARNAELLDYVEDELSLFEDEELEDDEDLEDLPELPDLEESTTTP